MSYASGNTSGVVAGATLKHWAEIDMLHVPYKSAPPAIQDLLAGRVSMMFIDFTTGMPHVQAKNLRALAVTRIQRSSLFPELPTMDEAGVTGLRHGFLGRHLCPSQHAAGDRHAAQHRAAQDHRQPGREAKLRAAGFEAFSSSPKEMDDFTRAQLAKWGKMIKDAGIQPE